MIGEIRKTRRKRKNVSIKSIVVILGFMAIIGLFFFMEQDYKQNIKNQNNSFNSEVKPTDAPEKKLKIALIGDSNTEISYFKKVPAKRWASIISQDLNASVYNLGKDGQTTNYFLTTAADQVVSAKADYYIICLGLNDVRFIKEEEFKKQQRQLIELIKTKTNGKPILMTNVKVDYPNHMSFDRNTLTIEPFDNAKRELAKELNIGLVDVYSRFDKEIKEGNWDHRIRTNDIWDNSNDEGKTVGTDGSSGYKWFDNIHYNVEGNRIVADEVVKYFKKN